MAAAATRIEHSGHDMDDFKEIMKNLRLSVAASLIACSMPALAQVQSVNRTANGPTGTDIESGIVPAFLGGFVVLNGTHNNLIQNNEDWASTGTALSGRRPCPRRPLSEWLRTRQCCTAM